MRGVYPQWASDKEFWKHYRKHWIELGVLSATQYDHSARVIVRTGKRFTYRTPGGRPRVGYFDQTSGLLTALTRDEVIILTHYRPQDGATYVRALPESTYP